MFSSVYKLVVNKIYGELPFGQALSGSRVNRGTVDRSIIGWTRLCAFLMHGDYDRLFPLKMKSTALNREVKCVCQQH